MQEIIVKKSPNFTPGNNSFTPIGFVIHGTLGNFDGAVEWLCTGNRSNPSSAHFVVAKDGRIAQLVDIKDIAWHAGKVFDPSPYAQKVLQKNALGFFKNPNSYLIGIELEWFAGEQVTEKQMQSVMQIISMCHIINPFFIGHTDIASYKTDDMEFVCKIIRERLTAPVVPTKDVFTTPMSIGDFGPQVTMLQKMLIKEGIYTEQPSGQYGTTTANAVWIWQLRHNVAPFSTLLALRGSKFGPASMATANKLYGK